MIPVDVRAAMTVPGQTSRQDLAWLSARAREAQVAIEVGCYLGRSTRALADACRGVVYAVDLWAGPQLREDGTATERDWHVFGQFCANLRAHIDAGRVVPLRTSFATAAATLVAGHVQADLVFIDADHRYAAVAADIVAARTVVRPGGTICGHDYTNAKWPGVARGAREAFGDALRVDGAIWWAVQP